MVCAVNSEDYDDELNNFCSLYREQVNSLHMSAQLSLVKNILNYVNYIDIFNKISQFKNLLIPLYLVLPTTNTGSNGSGSTLRHMKN